MKNAFKKWFVYPLTSFGMLVIFLGAYLPYKFCGSSNWPYKYSFYTCIFAGVAFLLIGFIIQDLYRGWVRQKINDWDNKLDKKYITKAWTIYLPLFLSGASSLIIGLILNFFVK